MKITKKLLIILCVLILCLMCTKIISLAQTATIITETLRLRKEPTTDSKILDLISEDEKVEVLESGLGDDGNWYKVKYNDITGYVYGEYIKVNNTTTNTTTNTNTTTANQETNTNTVNNTTIENNVTESNTISNTNVENTIENVNIENNIEENTVNAQITEPDNQTTTNEETINNIEINTEKTVNEDTELYIIPLINADKIYTIKPEETVTVIQVLNGWAYVSNNNISGWIRCSALT